MNRRFLGLILVGAISMGLCACGEEKQDLTQESGMVQESHNQDEAEPEVTQNVELEEQESQNEETQESEVVDENVVTSPLVGKQYKKEDGTTLEILGYDSDGYINAIKLNGIEINVSNVQFLEGHYGPDENTYYGEFNNGIDRIGISYFKTDDTKLVIRLEVGIAPDGITKEAEVEVIQDGTYYLE